MFLVQVTVCGQSAEGMGPSKKVAKRNAAEKMLDLLGYKVPQPQPPKPALKTDEKVVLDLCQPSLENMANKMMLLKPTYMYIVFVIFRPQ